MAVCVWPGPHSVRGDDDEEDEEDKEDEEDEGDEEDAIPHKRHASLFTLCQTSGTSPADP